MLDCPLASHTSPMSTSRRRSSPGASGAAGSRGGGAAADVLATSSGVSSRTRVTFPERIITSEKKRGKHVPVEVPTHVAGILDFANGAVGTMVTSFDVWRGSCPCIEIHGTQGSLSVPDPNSFGGPVRVFRAGYDDWKDVPLTHIYAEQSRGLGLADMAVAIRDNRPHRANGVLAYHALDIMHAFHDASDAAARVTLASTCERPAPMATDLREGVV